MRPPLVNATAADHADATTLHQSAMRLALTQCSGCVIWTDTSCWKTNTGKTQERVRVKLLDDDEDDDDEDEDD